ncbi:protease modulator HflK [Schlesneria paludicola]|uniref:protease modulator HflK n=1 Tax=Schlesneria paludicola TaxID=360056 RepID=UPI00029ACC9F|nr:protease modulator HflK [Schlesneria paludicola]
MKLRHVLFVAILGYLATGVFVVPANEKAVVRRFGRVVTPLRSSGLHYDFPWPLSRVDRVNLNEVRTLTLGDLEVDANFLQSTSATRPMTFLTGDKNLLLLRITVQYRISQDELQEWLYGSRSAVDRLQLLVETTVADLVSRSGVDFVHTQGLAELNNRLLRDVRQQAARLRLGCEVEQVTVDRAEPPARVKAEFLDVSNARADRARSINEARSFAEQKLAEAQADARKLMDDAERERNGKLSASRGSADRFAKLVSQIQLDAAQGGRTYRASRLLVTQRMTLETLRDVLARLKVKIVLDGEHPFDLSFPNDRQD